MNRQLAKGTFEWTCVAATVTVPEKARRMVVYAGLTPATGSLLIDDLKMSITKDSMPERHDKQG